MSKASAASAPAPAADPGAQAAPAANKKRRLLPALGAVAAIAAAGGGGAWWYNSQQPVDPAAKPEAPNAEAPKPPVFVNLEPFTVNLKNDGSADHYLQVGIALQVAGPEASDAIKLHQPVIRGKILLLLSSKGATELAGLEAKNALAAEILAATRAPLPGTDPKKGVLAVHFASFIIQ